MSFFVSENDQPKILPFNPSAKNGYWQRLSSSLKKKEINGVIDFYQKAMHEKCALIPHPFFENVATKAVCSFSHPGGWSNAVLFEDDSGGNRWVLIQSYNAIDAIYFNGFIYSFSLNCPIYNGFNYKCVLSSLYSLYIKSNEVLDERRTTFLVCHERPYHFFFDRLFGVFLYKLRAYKLPRIVEEKPYFSVQRFGLNTSPYKKENVCFYPVFFNGFFKDNALLFKKFVAEINPFPSKSEQFYKEKIYNVWFGISAIKRSWVEQEEGCLVIAQVLKEKFDGGVRFYIDGHTAVDGQAIHVAEEEKIFNSISHKLKEIGVESFSLIGKDYFAKIKAANGCDGFVSNSGSGALVPMCFANLPGVIHGVIDPFKKIRKYGVCDRALKIPSEFCETAGSGNATKNIASASYNMSVDVLQHYFKKKLFGEDEVFQAKNLNVIKPSDVDLIRDSALVVEGLGDIELAYKLMHKAYELRPSGPFIKKKLDEYLAKKETKE